jgi:prepilin-type N-terminal cleavage/methylation domain-containing protein
MPRSRTSKGFTLIELGIVLAVAAIVIAGILMAGDGVFGRAGVTSLLSNVKDLATASREFKVRYGYPPGDLPNAGTHITANGGISGGCNYAVSGSVGNGIVDSATESNCALEHLVKAGMLSKVEYDASAARYYIKLVGGTADSVTLWFDSGSNRNAVRITNVPCEHAQELERKLDSATTDNKPFAKGAVTARDASDAGIDTCSSGGSNDPVASVLIRY